ncbi:MAG: HAMP domain-containing histidine kinase [Lachnospiraceae bacterium]|nr:HAMP domain-containing histidine kinase [Lachnospiraceae bacterium]
MDTNLKKSKKIRAFIYKIIAVASFFTMIGTAAIGREALINLYKEGHGTFTGDIYYLTEFREYISELYTYGMLGYAGAGDDHGYPLTSNGGQTVTTSAQKNFNKKLADSKEDLLYYVKFKEKTVARGGFSYPLFSEYDGHLLLPEDVILCCYWDGSNETLQFFPEDKHAFEQKPENYYVHQYKANSKMIGQVQLLLALKDTDNYTSSYFIELQTLARDYQRILQTFFTSAVLFLISFVLSVFNRKAVRNALLEFGNITQVICLEGKVLLTAVLIYLCYSCNLWYFNGSRLPRYYAISFLWLYALIAVVVYLFLNDCRYNRLNTFKHSILYGILHCCYEFIKGVSWYRKSIIIYAVYFVSGLLSLSMGIVFWYFCASKQLYYTSAFPLKVVYVFAGALIVLGILMLWLSVRLKHYISDTTAIAAKLGELSVGESKTKIHLSRHSLLTQTASDVEALEQGIEAAVEQNIRANRMRVELITNVSHDLKTPLTSIINYADLLCEENLPAPANDYATALRGKAYRLKGMVQDVFELSKATSGNLPVEKVRLDLAKLIRQTLADMDERIQESSLTFKLNIISEPLMIEADGEKLYRVFQNLIINALQYSLENSRVHIQLDKQDTNALVWVKNTSRRELDFDPEEIMERFVRADASRTTEGSGLGLSIVQSFTEACGGRFNIELNADLFTACVSFPLSEEPIEDTIENEEKKEA